VIADQLDEIRKAEPGRLQDRPEPLEGEIQSGPRRNGGPPAATAGA